MYNIIKNGEVIATVDNLQYVRRQRNGVFINCAQRDAQGICVNDIFYHLPWLPALSGCDDVTYEEFSGVDAMAEYKNYYSAVNEALK